MTQPSETAPWYGRSAGSGETLIVAGRETAWREADASIPGGWPMVNDGQGWRVDHAAHRTPYSPHPEVQKLPAHRTKHSGSHTKFCVLCLSGDHQRTDDAVLGTTTGQPETEAAPAVDRATVLRERADFFEGVLRNAADPGSDPRYWSAVSDVIRGLRQQAAKAQQPTPAPAEETKPEGWVPKRVSLGTPCAGCRHARNWHTGDDSACTVGECGCTQFRAMSTPAP